MRRFMFAGAAALALAFVAAVPAQSRASWLSQFLHSRFDPDYYAAPAYPYGAYDYAPPAVDYYAPPAVDYYSPPTVYYTEPYYYGYVGPSYYWRSGPRYYGHYRYGDWDRGRGWHGHEGRGHHHR